MQKDFYKTCCRLCLHDGSVHQLVDICSVRELRSKLLHMFDIRISSSDVCSIKICWTCLHDTLAFQKQQDLYEEDKRNVLLNEQKHNNEQASPAPLAPNIAHINTEAEVTGPEDTSECMVPRRLDDTSNEEAPLISSYNSETSVEENSLDTRHRNIEPISTNDNEGMNSNVAILPRISEASVENNSIDTGNHVMPTIATNHNDGVDSNVAIQPQISTSGGNDHTNGLASNATAPAVVPSSNSGINMKIIHAVLPSRGAENAHVNQTIVGSKGTSNEIISLKPANNPAKIPNVEKKLVRLLTKPVGVKSNYAASNIPERSSATSSQDQTISGGTAKQVPYVIAKVVNSQSLNKNPTVEGNTSAGGNAQKSNTRVSINTSFVQATPYMTVLPRTEQPTQSAISRVCLNQNVLTVPNATQLVYAAPQHGNRSSVNAATTSESTSTLVQTAGRGVQSSIGSAGPSLRSPSAILPNPPETSRPLLLQNLAVVSAPSTTTTNFQPVLATMNNTNTVLYQTTTSVTQSTNTEINSTPIESSSQLPSMANIASANQVSISNIDGNSILLDRALARIGGESSPNPVVPMKKRRHSTFIRVSSNLFDEPREKAQFAMLNKNMLLRNTEFQPSPPRKMQITIPGGFNTLQPTSTIVRPVNPTNIGIHYPMSNAIFSNVRPPCNPGEVSLRTTVASNTHHLTAAPILNSAMQQSPAVTVPNSQYLPVASVTNNNNNLNLFGNTSIETGNAGNSNGNAGDKCIRPCFRCNLCNMFYLVEKNLRLHLQRVHNTLWTEENCAIVYDESVLKKLYLRCRRKSVADPEAMRGIVRLQDNEPQ